MKRRNPPELSQTLFRIPGNLLSSRSITSLSVPASTSTTSAPPVCFRRGVGMTTLSDMSDSSFHDTFESIDLRVDDIGCVHRDCLWRLEAVAGNRDDGYAASIDMALLDEFLQHRNAHAPRGLRIDSLRFGKQADAFADLRIRSVVSPAPGALNESGSV